MSDLSSVHRVPEALFAALDTARRLSACFLWAEVEGEQRHALVGELDVHFYNMAVELNDAVACDSVALFAKHAEEGTLQVHEDVDAGVQLFVRNSQMLLKHVFRTEEAVEGNDSADVDRINSWKLTFNSLARLLLKLLKVELALCKECLASRGLSQIDVEEAKFSSRQIHTHRADVWGWQRTREELIATATVDDRAVNVVSELRTRRVVDRVNTGIAVGESALRELWREEEEEDEDEEEEEEVKESLRLKKGVTVALECMRVAVGKLRERVIGGAGGCGGRRAVAVD